MISIQDIEKIEQYLEGKLSGTELTEFKQLLSSNPELAEMADSFKFAIEGVNVYNRNQLKAKLGQIQKEVAPIISTRNSSLKYYIGGATLAILAGLFFLFNPFAKTENQDESVQNAILEESINDQSTVQITDKTSTQFETDQNKIEKEIVNKNTKQDIESEIEIAETTPVEQAVVQNPVSDKQNSFAEPDNKSSSDNRRSDEIPEAQFVANKSNGCAPISVKFTDQSTIQSGVINKWIWDFGDGTSSIEQNPIHIYKSGGSYTVSLTVWSQNGNSNKISKDKLANVYVSPHVDFKTDPEIVQAHMPDVKFINNSTHVTKGTKYKWDFGDQFGSSIKKDPEYSYMDTGSYIISLTATTENGCIDKAFRGIVVVPEVSCYCPSAFSPNGTGPTANNTYRVSAKGFTEFYIIIYSRYGEVVYESKNYRTHGWDGNYNGSSPQNQEAEVFISKIRLIGFDGKEYNFKESITLIR